MMLPFVKNIHLVAEAHFVALFNVVLWCMHFTIKQQLNNSDFHFHSSLLTSDKTVALLRSRSAPRPFISGRFTFSAKCSQEGDQTCIRKEWRALDRESFLYRLMLSLLPKHVWRQRSDICLSPNDAFCMCECWGAHSPSDIKDLPRLVSEQEDSRCIRGLRVLVKTQQAIQDKHHLCLWGQKGLWEFVPEPVWCKCTSNICLTNSRGHIQNRVFSVYARGCSPSSLSPQVEQYGQFSHISTCITLCTSHNWSTTVTGYIRCFSTYFLHKFYAINVT